MSNIRIVTDSTCDIEPSLLNGYRLDILPLVISIEEQSYLDGEEIRIEEVYEYMRKGVVPKTSQIPYERTYPLFRSILERGEDFLYISFSSELSGCFSLGSMVAEELRAEFPGRNIAVVDSKAGAGATGLIVLQALKMAAAGLPFDTVKAETEFLADHIEHVFSVGDLEWLAKGGRIPKVVGYVGSKLGFHPILEVEKGRMVVRRMVRGKSNAIQAVANDIIQRAQKFPAQLVAICHADDLLSAQKLEALIKEGLSGCVTTLCHIGGVLGVHLGLKGIGAFCFNQKSEQYSLI
jgi:DegV family protein with EDD domain